MSISDYFSDGRPGFGRQVDLAEPDVLRAGDSLTWTAKWSGYPSAAGWALTYIINSPTARFAVATADVVLSLDGVSFDIVIPSSETKAWTAGKYQWIAVLVLGAQRVTVGLGEVTILPNLLDAIAPVDTRSQAEIDLATVEASIRARAVGGVDSYMISGRELKYMAIADLYRMRTQFRQQVRQERIDRGEIEPSSTVVVQFGGYGGFGNCGGGPWR